MTYARAISLAVLVLAAVSISHADTITSTGLGGLWTDTLTWQGGVVPGSGDDVVIAGPVQVNDRVYCQSIHVQTAGTVTAALVALPRTLVVSGAVVNEGGITDGGSLLFLELGGDIHNAGAWDTWRTTLTGNTNRELSDISAGGIDTTMEPAPGAGADITVTTPVALRGVIDVTGFRLLLQPGSHLRLPATGLSGEVLAAGNEIRFESWSYLEACTIDDAILVGDAEVTFNVVFTTRVTVMGLLQNATQSGGGAAIIEGDLVNHGVIQNDQYSFFFQVHGNVENHGTIAVPNLEFRGEDVTHRLSMGPDAQIYSSVFMPEFQVSTLIAETPVTFGGGLGLGQGTLILEPGASIHFPNHSGVSSWDGVIEANGNTISTEGTNSAISEVTIDRAVLGDATVLSNVLFTDGLTVTGNVAGFTWDDADLTVEGRLRVEGSIADGGQPVRVTVLNDLENLGAMTNSRVTLAGVVDQFVGAGPGIAVPEFVIESGLEAASYQWYRDGAMLPGEDGASLILNTVGPADYGRYHCEGDGLVSRDVFIAEALDTTDVPGLAAAALEQNHPNPFNPATNIAFRLEQAGPVSLVVYDLAGREVDRLVGGELGAGRHTVTWQPRGIASGTYVYRLRADGVDVSRKCSLLK